MLRRDLLGYVLKDKSFHVCGYELNKTTYAEYVLIQINGSEVKKYMINQSTKGYFFNYKGKRIYLPTTF